MKFFRKFLLTLIVAVFGFMIGACGGGENNKPPGRTDAPVIDPSVMPQDEEEVDEDRPNRLDPEESEADSSDSENDE